MTRTGAPPRRLWRHAPAADTTSSPSNSCRPTGIVYTRPLLRPVTFNSISCLLSSPCAGDRSSTLITGLTTRITAAGGCRVSTVGRALELMPFSLPALTPDCQEVHDDLVFLAPDSACPRRCR